MSTQATAQPAPQLLAVCTGGLSRLRLANGRSVPSGFRKTARAGGVVVTPLGLEGDAQADRKIHGGIAKAVYAYPAEHLAYWQEARRAAGAGLFDDDEDTAALAPGFVGENLSLCGVQEAAVWIGDTLRFAGSSCVLRVTSAREPCGKFTAVMGVPHAGACLAEGARCGFYLAVEVPGLLAAGMALTLHAGARRLSVADDSRVRWSRRRLR